MSNLRLCEAFQLRGVSAVFKLCAIRIADQTHEYEIQFTLCMQDIADFACCTLDTAEGVLNELVFHHYIASWQYLGEETTEFELWHFPRELPARRVSRDLSPSVRRAVFARDGEVCAYCGTTEGPFHIDHIHPKSRGGSDDLENLTVACAPCNLSKRDKTLEEWGGRQCERG